MSVSRLPLISIVDDDQSVRESLMRLMRAEGLRAKAFACAEDFLNSDHLDETRCLILDVSLPGMSGLQLQSHLIASNKHIPIIFISGIVDDRTQAQALQAGAIALLCKPFSVDALLRTLNSIIGQKSI